MILRPWACCGRFCPKRELFFPTVAKRLLIVGSWQHKVPCGSCCCELALSIKVKCLRRQMSWIFVKNLTLPKAAILCNLRFFFYIFNISRKEKKQLRIHFMYQLHLEFSFCFFNLSQLQSLSRCCSVCNIVQFEPDLWGIGQMIVMSCRFWTGHFEKSCLLLRPYTSFNLPGFRSQWNFSSGQCAYPTLRMRCCTVCVWGEGGRRGVRC